MHLTKKTLHRWMTIGALALGAGLAIAAAACSDTQSAVAPSAANGSAAAMTDSGNGMTMPTTQSSQGAQIYVADLKPLNPQVGFGAVTGQAKFQIVNGMFVAMDEAKNVQPGVIHPQHIHAAAECPPPSADVNHDGYIDVIEGVPFYGAILVPMDSDLTNQAAGTFPSVDNPGGALHYRQAAPFAALLADLNAPDPDPTDAVVKLNGAPLNLPGRHVVVHGVSLDTPLPSTVASLPGLPAQLTLPVACGEISAVNR